MISMAYVIKLLFNLQDFSHQFIFCFLEIQKGAKIYNMGKKYCFVYVFYCLAHESYCMSACEVYLCKY